MIKAFIFDLDGIIADSEHFSEEAGIKVWARYGVRMTRKERKEAIGRRVEEIFEDMLKARNLKMSIPKLVKEKDAIFNKIIKGTMKPIRNSIELVKSLKEKGYEVAIATSSHTIKMDAELKELGIDHLFDVKINGDHIKKGKPNPEIFLVAAKKLGVMPEECAVIEDAEYGVQAAKNAGMYAIALHSPNSPNQDLSKADMVVDDLAEVQEHISDLASRK